MGLRCLDLTAAPWGLVGSDSGDAKTCIGGLGLGRLWLVAATGLLPCLGAVIIVILRHKVFGAHACQMAIGDLQLSTLCDSFVLAYI